MALGPSGTTARDDRGEVTTSAPWRMWAAGDIAGYVGPEAAKADGHRVAGSILDALGQETAS